MTSLDDAAATLRVIIPGFLALRVIYWHGLRTQRTDLELILWSLVVSVPIYAVAAFLRPQDDLSTLTVAVGVAIIVGFVIAQAWRWLVARRPEYRDYMVPTAWDAVLAKPGGGWVQAKTTDGATYQGWVRIAADSAQTSNLDLYLYDPGYVDDKGSFVPIPSAEGVLLQRSSVVSVVRFAEDAEPNSAPEAGTKPQKP